MNKLTRWFKTLSRQEKTMFVFILLLILCVITRWGYIRSEAGSAFRDRFTSPQEQTAE